LNDSVLTDAPTTTTSIVSIVDKGSDIIKPLKVEPTEGVTVQPVQVVTIEPVSKPGLSMLFFSMSSTSIFSWNEKYNTSGS